MRVEVRVNGQGSNKAGIYWPDYSLGGWREITETSVVELIQLRNAINEALELDTR